LNIKQPFFNPVSLIGGVGPDTASARVEAVLRMWREITHPVAILAKAGAARV